MYILAICIRMALCLLQLFSDIKKGVEIIVSKVLCNSKILIMVKNFS